MTMRYDQEPPLGSPLADNDIACVERSPFTIGAPFNKFTMLDLAFYMKNKLSSPSETIYVAKNGNDLTGNGTILNPYLTLAKALSVANGTAISPVQINLFTADYVEITIELKPFVYINGNNSSITITNPVTKDSTWTAAGTARFENFYSCTFLGGFNLNFSGLPTCIVYLQNINLAAACNIDITGDPSNGAISIIDNIVGFGGQPSYFIQHCYGAIFNGAAQNIILENCPNYNLQGMTELGSLVASSTSTVNSTIFIRNNYGISTFLIDTTSTGTCTTFNIANEIQGTITLNTDKAFLVTDALNQVPTLTGGALSSQITYYEISDTIAANYIPTNYTPVNTSIKGHLEGINTALATPTFATLTIGTGLAGGSYNGSAPVTITIDSSVVTLNGTQILSNKTLVNPIINNTFAVLDDSQLNKMTFFVNPGSSYGSDLSFTINTNNISGALSFNGPVSFANQFTTSGNFPVQQIYTGTTNATFPSGTYTLAKADEVTNGNVTKYVVGETLATAPYDDIDTALAAANAEFLSTSKQQEVFIQPGEYNGFTPVQGVNICALGNSQNYFSANIGARSSVKIISQVIISNSLDISISGLTFANSNPAQSCITSSGTNTAYINFNNCVIEGNGLFPAFDGSNPNCYYSFNNTLSSSKGSFPVFFPTAGNFKFKNCVQIGSGNPSRFTTSTAEYYNCYIKDSIEVNTLATVKIYNSWQETLGFYAAVILQTTNSNLITDHTTFTVPSGITNYVFEGAAGASVTVNNATFVDLQKIDPNLDVHSYAQNTNNGNLFILTNAGNYNFTPTHRILILNKSVAASTTAFLPPPGTSIGATYEITDGKGNAATHNFTLDAGVGYLINNAQTAVGNIAYQSITVRDIGTKYIII